MNKNIQQRKRVIWISCAGLAFGVFLSVNSFGSGVWVRGLLLHLSQPLLMVSDLVVGRAVGVGKSLVHVSLLSDQNQNLQNKVDALTAYVSTLENFERQNEQLRFLSAQQKRPELSLIGARTYGFDNISKKRSFHIDRGTNDNIRSGAPVVAPGNVLIGFVEQVYESAANVRFVTNQDIKLTGYLKSSDQIFIQNDARLGLIGQDISQDIEVLENDPVFYRQKIDSGGIEDLVIGYVRLVRLAENELSQEIIIDTAVDFERVQFVSVLINAKL